MFLSADDIRHRKMDSARQQRSTLTWFPPAVTHEYAPIERCKGSQIPSTVSLTVVLNQKCRKKVTKKQESPFSPWDKEPEIYLLCT